jgi:hypothetical protein
MSANVVYDVYRYPHKYTQMKTIQMTIDERLLKLVDKMTRARKTTRSAFIRDALEAKIKRESIREKEVRHADGYAQKPAVAGEFEDWLSEQDWGAS